MKWLPDMDLNHDKQIQSLLCYRYTIGQAGAVIKVEDTKIWSSHVCSYLIAFVLILGSMTLCGQPYPLVLDGHFLQFIDENMAFSSAMDASPTFQGPDVHWPVKVAVLKGMTRVDMDITDVTQKSKPLYFSKEMAAALRQAGNSEYYTIFNPSRKAKYLVVPKLKIYLETSLADKEIRAFNERPKPTITQLEPETLGHHLCKKTKVSFDSKLLQTETPSAIVWKADDLNGYPVRIELMDSRGSTNYVVTFENIKFKAPNPALFEPPADFVKYNSEQQFNDAVDENARKLRKHSKS